MKLVGFTDGTRNMLITESTDTAFTLTEGKLILRIDRTSGTVRLTRGSRYLNISCQKGIPHVEACSLIRRISRDKEPGSGAAAPMKRHDGFGLFQRQPGGIGHGVLGCPARASSMARLIPTSPRTSSASRTTSRRRTPMVLLSFVAIDQLFAGVRLCRASPWPEGQEAGHARETALQGGSDAMTDDCEEAPAEATCQG